MQAVPNPIQRLKLQVEQRPDAPWLHQSINGVWRAYSYREVLDQVLRMAEAITKLGIAKGSSIAISGRNTAHWIMADMAITAAGCVSVGLYPKQSQEHTRFILSHSEAQVVFIGPMMDAEEFMSALPESIVRIRFPYPDAPPCALEWDSLIAQHQPIKEPYNVAPGDLLTLVYTSGTTGNPKGVMITWRNAAFTIEGLLKVLPPKKEEIFFSYLPLAHMFERGVIGFSSLYLGAQVYFLEHLDKLAEQLAFVRPTRFFGVPLVYTRIQAGILKKMPQAKIDKLLRIPIISGIVKNKIKRAVGLDRAWLVFSGAAPMPKALIEWFAKLDIDVLQGYGMTENSIYATICTPWANKVGTVGKEMPGANMKLSDEGEILFKHPGVMAGYYKEPQKTEETFTDDGYLRTGDKGKIDSDGYLSITGRVKDIFKTMKGKYVAPAPIEGALARNTDIEQLCFVGSELKQPIMLVTLSAQGRSKPKAEVEAGLIAEMQQVNANLEAHEEIGKIVIIDEAWTIDNGLMTPTMKVKRPQVESRYKELIASEGEKRNKVSWQA